MGNSQSFTFSRFFFDFQWYQWSYITPTKKSTAAPVILLTVCLLARQCQWKLTETSFPNVSNYQKSPNKKSRLHKIPAKRCILVFTVQMEVETGWNPSSKPKCSSALKVFVVSPTTQQSWAELTSKLKGTSKQKFLNILTVKSVKSEEENPSENYVKTWSPQVEELFGKKFQVTFFPFYHQIFVLFLNRSLPIRGLHNYPRKSANCNSTIPVKFLPLVNFAWKNIRQMSDEEHPLLLGFFDGKQVFTIFF